jgi:hypothetical protein
VLRALGYAKVKPVVSVPDEDWAALGGAVFLAGAPVLGYREGTVTFPYNPPKWELSAALRGP